MKGEDDRPTVLVVDDEQGLADLYEAWLTQDFTTESVYHGRDAIERLADDIDIVLLDRRMPGVSGDEVIEHIYDREFDCRVALISGIEPDLDLLDLPIDGYLIKPIEQDELLGLVEDLLGVSGYDRSLKEIHRLATTLSAVEQAASTEELETSDRYRALYQRLQGLREELSEVDRGQSQSEFDETVRDLLNNPSLPGESGVDSSS